MNNFTSTVAAAVLAATLSATPADAALRRPAWQSCALSAVTPGVVDPAECMADARRDLGDAVADSAQGVVESSAQAGVAVTGWVVSRAVRVALCWVWGRADGLLRVALPEGTEAWLDRECQ